MAMFLGPALALTLSALLVDWMLRRGDRAIALDHPNERSLHDRPTPRTGGIAIVCGSLAGALVSKAWEPSLWLGLAIAGVSLADDVRGLPVRWRMVAHLAAATAAVWTAPDVPAWLWPFLVFGIAWMTNLYNFMDGADGLAGGMAVFGFGSYAAAAVLAGNVGLASASLCIAASALGFLLFNFPPARIFMGDVGSIFLGFLAGGLGVHGWRSGAWPSWFPVVVFAPFVVDATVTLARRALRRERVWEAHRGHFYQRLILSGWTHRGTAIAEYVLMACCSAAALFARGIEPVPRILTLAAVATLLGLSAVLVERRSRGAVR